MRPKGVADGHPVNIPELVKGVITLMLTQEVGVSGLLDVSV